MNNLHFKAMNGQMTVDEAQGIVECFVAAIGNKDSVGDIIIPGAFDKSFKKRKPRVVWGHDWNQPIGKVLDIYEVGPRDPRLPGKMKAAGVGGVFAKVQFNLNSERGREAFSNILFFGEEQEWSIGYKTLDAVWDPTTQANVLKELELYEVSPVLHGANQLTATISIKDAKGADTEDEITSLRDSKWDTFDIAWAKKLKDEHPDIWSKGGNIKGNDQWRILTQIAEKGRATSQAELNALKLREAWIARHKGDFRLAGVVAQIKWLAVGTRGEDYMKNLVREAIDRRHEKGYWDDDLDSKGDSVLGLRVGAFVRWDSSGGTAYGKVLRVAKGGTVSAQPSGPQMRGTEDNPAVEVQVLKFANGAWKDTDTVTVHRSDALTALDTLPKTKAAPGAQKLQDLATALGDRIPTGSNLIPDVLPQERVTGDILHGHGPRRGNLEKLLRYWRPIMRKPGGFRRCRVILADHPELYPLDNLCAWLHHETTGLWPNEGCHHPGMKNCRRKLKQWSDGEFGGHLGRLIPGGKGKKDAMWGEEQETPYDFWAHESDESEEHESLEEHEAAENPEHENDEEMMLRFGRVLREFAENEPEFMAYLADDDNWAHEGQEHEEDDWHEHMALVPMGKKPCGCGCGDEKSGDTDDLSVKAGRILSGRNRTRLKDAMELIKAVLDEADIDIKDDGDGTVAFKTVDAHNIVADIAPILGHHGISVKVSNDTIVFPSGSPMEMLEAVETAMVGLGYDAKGFGRALGNARKKFRKPARFDMNAPDGDNDGIVQEGTTAEHPTTRAVGEAGKKIRRALGRGGKGGGGDKPIVHASGHVDPVFKEGDFDNIKAEQAAYKRIRDEYNAMMKADETLWRRFAPRSRTNYWLPNDLTPMAPHEKPLPDEQNARYVADWAEKPADEIRAAQLSQAMQILNNIGHVNTRREDHDLTEGGERTKYQERIGRRMKQVEDEFDKGDLTLLEAVTHLWPKRRENYKDRPDLDGGHSLLADSEQRTYAHRDIKTVVDLIGKVNDGTATEDEAQRLRAYGVFDHFIKDAPEQKPDADRLKEAVDKARGGDRNDLDALGKKIPRHLHERAVRALDEEPHGAPEIPSDEAVSKAADLLPSWEREGLADLTGVRLSGTHMDPAKSKIPAIKKALADGNNEKAVDDLLKMQSQIDNLLKRFEGKDKVPTEVTDYLNSLRAMVDDMATGVDGKDLKFTEKLVAAAKSQDDDLKAVNDALDEFVKDLPDPIELGGEIQMEGRRGEYYVQDEFLTQDELHSVVVDEKNGRIGIITSIDDPEDLNDGEGGYSLGSASVTWFSKDGADWGDEVDASELGSDGSMKLYAPAGKLVDVIEEDLHNAPENIETQQSFALNKAVRLYSLNPEAAADMIYSLNGQIPDAMYESLLKQFKQRTEGISPKAVKGLNSVNVETHKAVASVVRYHGIPYTVDGDTVEYDVSRAAAHAKKALNNAIGNILSTKRDYGTEKRGEYAERGLALPDGSFPIRDVGDLRNAIKAYGRAKDKETAKRHIVKRARALGATDELPEGWG